MNTQEILSRLTLTEKISLLTGKNFWQTQEVDRANIPSLWLSDGPHGVRKIRDAENQQYDIVNATCFPTASSMASTWNRSLIKKVGYALGEECQAYQVDILLGPGVNIKRTPLCGRNFEYYSEDPVLAGECGAAYIKGIQQTGVGACVKHFAANNQEYDRWTISAEIDERALREIYLPAFETVIRESNPISVMCAYNKINGVYCSENRRLLLDILRNEYGFRGFVMSDWGAVHQRANALNATLELEMPYREQSKQELLDALDKKQLTVEQIDEAVGSLLNAIQALRGAKPTNSGKIDFEGHYQLALKAAQESIILLKNHEGVLPLKADTLQKVAVIGNMARNPVIQGDGSACVQAAKQSNPFDELVKRLPDVQVEYVDDSFDHTNLILTKLERLAEQYASYDAVILFVGDRFGVEGENYDRQNLDLPFEQMELIKAISSRQRHTIVVTMAGSAINMSAWADRTPAILQAGYCGEAVGEAVAQILLGEINPSGKLAETIPQKLEDTPAFKSYPGNGMCSRYEEGVMVGYRYYSTYHIKTQFPFGHGLSYTTFEYHDLRLAYDKAMNSVHGIVVVQNTGEWAGYETVQVYVKPPQSGVIRPVMELKAFEKVWLEPGEKKEVSFCLTNRCFAYYNVSLMDWFVEKGNYGIAVGSSCADIRLLDYIQIVPEKQYS